MQAIIVNEYTDYKNASAGELADPKPGKGQVVVALETAEVNFADKLFIEGNYQRQLPFPFSPGLAGAGVVCELGEGVETLGLGQRVLALPEYGAYAEKVVLSAAHCFPIPEGINNYQAASLGLAYQTAYFALSARGRLCPGEKVLVLGATGGVGMAAVQLARAMGASAVIAGTRGGDDRIPAVALGADAVVDTSTGDVRDFARSVKTITDDYGVDIVIDPVGGAIGEAALRTLAWNGRYVVVGFAGGGIPVFAGNYLLVKNIAVCGLQWTDYLTRQPDLVRQAQDKIFEWCRTGVINTLIDAVYPLSSYADALSMLCNGDAIGRVILNTTGK